jgi:glutamyl-tRNA(Gln) amidotransferase subunit E
VSRDYEDLGFMAGLEIHQQLDAGKLFCRCPPTLDEAEHTDVRFERTLRPTQSELGEVDQAAQEEARRDRVFEYEAAESTTCLVEMDEEPPHPLDREALDVALTAGLMVDMEPVDEVHVMRKIVIDGSNTTGFQRTALLAEGGSVETDAGEVGLETLCLEEDAARKVDAGDGPVAYRLDRLGIPLVEIATAPDLTHPDQVRAAAEALGNILRATGDVKRGLGTIRQDLNVSIEEGTRVELKGVQELEVLEDAARWEVERQLTLLDVADELADRSTSPKRVRNASIVDVTGALEGTDSGPVQGALEAGGGVLAVPLPGFEGLLGSKGEAPGEPRLGRELAEHAKARAGVPGVFQSDELPSMRISPHEVEAVRDQLDLEEADGFALVAAEAGTGRNALDAVRERAAQAFEGVPGETRDVLEDGTSRYLRPIPGEARMYPETDVPPFRVTDEHRHRLQDDLPETIEEKRDRLAEEYDLSGEEADVLVDRNQGELFERLVDETGRVRAAASLLVSHIPNLVREGHDEAAFTADRLQEALTLVDEGTLAKDALPEALAGAVEEDTSVAEAVEALGLTSADEEEVEAVVEEVLDEKEAMVEEQGMGAMGPLMGVLMERLGGRADGETVNSVLQEKLQERL